VDAWIPEPYAAGLTVGLPAKLRLDAQPDREFPAKVASVQQTVERRSDLDEGPIVRLELSLEDADLAKVRPGMRGQGRILVEERDDRLAVPIAAVEGGPSGPVVTRKTFFGVATRSVELGRRSGSWIEVVAGLDEGDRVMARR
jgi:multidrug efflux pump subunit AcrA (membrane-fusion protein)